MAHNQDMNALRNIAATILIALLASTLAQADVEGRWDGVIGPETLDLGVRVMLERDGDAWSGTIDIPDQGARGLPLVGVEVGTEGVRFTIDGVPGDPAFEGIPAGDRIEGTFSQGGQTFAFVLERSGGTIEAAPPRPPVEAAFVGIWEGDIGPGVADIGVIVTFADEAGVLVGSLDIPIQGLEGLALEIREVSPERIVFSIIGIPGDPTFAGDLGDDFIEGTFRQNGQELSFALDRVAEGEAPVGLNRPQEPVPPFPYREEEVRYRSGAVTLAATLTLPEGPGPHPAVVLITGSGPQDRDETLVGHRPFLVLADRLAREGFAVLRSDDRGVSGSGGDLSQTTYQELTDDVLAGVDFLLARSDIAADRIGVFGHSEGGYLGPLAALRSDAIAFVIMMAGPSVPGLEVLLIQNRLIFLLADADEGAIENQIAYLEVFAEALRLEDYQLAEAILRAEIAEQLAALPGDQRPAQDAIEEIIEVQVANSISPYFRELLIYDPQPTLRQLTVPVLAFYGTLDVQVPPVQSVGWLTGALRWAGNTDYTVEVFEGLNHLMQPAITGAIEEYGQIEITMAPEVLELVADWLRQRFR